MPIVMIVSQFHVMSKVPKPGCGLESECDTENFSTCLRAHFMHLPISNPGSTPVTPPPTPGCKITDLWLFVATADNIKVMQEQGDCSPLLTRI